MFTNTFYKHILSKVVLITFNHRGTIEHTNTVKATFLHFQFPQLFFKGFTCDDLLLFLKVVHVSHIVTAHNIVSNYIKVTRLRSETTCTLHVVPAILRMLRDPRTLPVCSSIMIGEFG